ncbi:MAG: DUF952 domain-containing protein [Gemmataceae bacterium]
MERIYHLVSRAVWEREPDADYRVASLASEGFIHCAFGPQVAWAANRFHRQTDDLVVLEIDPARLSSPLKCEAPAGKTELYPHVYGPINRAAVVRVHSLRRDDSGAWLFVP